jgi:5-methylcytosine-specific restriction enzyme subunit McrC
VSPLPRRVLELREHEPTRFARSEIPEDVGVTLWSRWGKYVSVEFPSPKTGHEWELRSQGYVGHIPLTADLALRLTPKVPIRNVFRMLEYAYRLDVGFGSDLVDSSAIEEFYDNLAALLAKRVLARARKGLYRAYVPEDDLLPYLRGALDLAERARRPWRTSIACRYEEHTADVDENQILAWTLGQVARSGRCSERVLPTVRSAYYAVRSATVPRPAAGADCVGRAYNRLNEDYRALHALCRFFLETTGPTHAAGDRSMLPFLIDMSRLFELFVAEWLRENLPPGLAMRAQEPLSLGADAGLDFRIDMVIYEKEGWRPVCVVDTKYKAPETVDPNDFNQIVVYAKGKGCGRGFLVYPVPLGQGLAVSLDDIRIAELTFGLDNDLDAAGQSLVSGLALG